MLRNDSYAGKYIGGYHISLELAASASSHIFLGESVSPDRHSAAIKRIDAISLLSRQDMESFLSEIDALKQLKHPSILPLLSAYILKGKPYIVSVYASNGSLHDLLQRQAPEPIAQDEAILILSQVGQALHYAHQRDRIHGNLKPQNILFTSKGDALLADFKLTSLSSPDNSTSISPNGLPYMSAEQIEGVNSKENDQYSLGCIAYEMFTGRKPFTTPSIEQPGTYYKTRALIAPTKLNLALPRSIEQAILKAMAKEPSQRFKNVSEFIKALGLPDILIVPDAPEIKGIDTIGAPTAQKNNNPLLPGLKAASTIGATTLVQFRAKSALLRNTFTSMTRFSTLPLVNGRLAIPFSTPQKRKVPWPFLLAASILLMIVLVAGMAFRFSSSRIQQGNKVSTGTVPTLPAQVATPHATTIPTKTPQHVVIPAQQPTVAPQPTQPVPTPTIHPTATTVPPTPTIPPTTLSIAPAILNAGNCALGSNTYTCTVTFSLGAAANGSQNWYTYSTGVGAAFNPSHGTITPGQAITIQITIFDTCTKMGTLIFVGSKTNVTAMWNC